MPRKRPRKSGRPVDHGMSGTKTYRAWETMMSTVHTEQCYVDFKWRKFSGFLAEMGLAPSKDYVFRRRLKAKGYSKENCSWAHKNSSKKTSQNYGKN